MSQWNKHKQDSPILGRNYLKEEKFRRLTPGTTAADKRNVIHVKWEQKNNKLKA